MKNILQENVAVKYAELIKISGKEGEQAAYDFVNGEWIEAPSYLVKVFYEDEYWRIFEEEANEIIEGWIS